MKRRDGVEETFAEYQDFEPVGNVRLVLLFKASLRDRYEEEAQRRRKDEEQQQQPGPTAPSFKMAQAGAGDFLALLERKMERGRGRVKEKDEQQAHENPRRG